MMRARLAISDSADAAAFPAIEIDATYRYAWFGLALLFHHHLKRYEDAESTYRKLIEIDEKNNGAWHALGRLLENPLRRFNEAEDAYRQEARRVCNEALDSLLTAKEVAEKTPR